MPAVSQCASSASSIPTGPQAQVARSARSGHQRGDRRGVEHPGGVGVLLDQPDPAVGGQVPQLGAEDDVVGGGRRVHEDDVGQLGVVAQHAHDRGDARSRP